MGNVYTRPIRYACRWTLVVATVKWKINPTPVVYEIQSNICFKMSICKFSELMSINERRNLRQHGCAEIL